LFPPRSTTGWDVIFRRPRAERQVSVMPSEPWFKFFAADYLLDGRVDSLPLEARAILISMWCLCQIEGSCSCPAQPEEIARKARLSQGSVVKHFHQLAAFFELRDGRLYSRRMEAERKKSDAARSSANSRWRPSNANRNASCIADSNAQSQSQKTNPSPFRRTRFQFFNSKERKQNRIFAG
jgi:uncharacterized protein YdaU (DUF1376 family)